MESLNKNLLSTTDFMNRDENKIDCDNEKKFFRIKTCHQKSQKTYTTQFCYQVFNQPLRELNNSGGVLTNFSKDMVNEKVIKPLFESRTHLLYPTLV